MTLKSAALSAVSWPSGSRIALLPGAAVVGGAVPADPLEAVRSIAVCHRVEERAACVADGEASTRGGRRQTEDWSAGVEPA